MQIHVLKPGEGGVAIKYSSLFDPFTSMGLAGGAGNPPTPIYTLEAGRRSSNVKGLTISANPESSDSPASSPWTPPGIGATIHPGLDHPPTL